jgi:hypothetical protein
MLIPIGKNQFVNPDHIKYVTEGRLGASLCLVGDDDVTTISTEDWQRIKPLIVAVLPAPSQAWAQTATVTATLITESDEGATPTLPQSIVEAVTAVEHARAREPFLEPLPELKGLYTACRDALPAPRLMKRED